MQLRIAALALAVVLYSLPVQAHFKDPATIVARDELIVTGWVICGQEYEAKLLVRARAKSLERAQAVYAELKDSGKCKVIRSFVIKLKNKIDVDLSQTDSAKGARATAFFVLVKLNVNGLPGYIKWQDAYVVSSGALR